MSQNAPTSGHLTIQQAQRNLRDRFKKAGIVTYELDARLLTGHALGLDDVGLIKQASREISEQENRLLETSCRARLAGKPVSRIIGVKEFYSLPFQISSATLDPRPDSECLVETALANAQKQMKKQAGIKPNSKTRPKTRQKIRPLKVLDLGTGSGCLLIALAYACQEKGILFQGLGVDISAPALRQARINAAINGVGRVLSFRQSNWFENVTEKFDIILSNPPYIASHEIETLASEVRKHDPLSALDGGADGLDAYRQIIADMTAYLKPEGCILFEIGATQSESVTKLVTQSLQSHRNITINHITDLAGLDRLVQVEFA